MSSRLRQSTGAPTPGRGNAATSASSQHQRSEGLPPYEPLAHPLKPNHRQKLSQLSHSPMFASMHTRLGEIMSCLSDVAGEINESVYSKQQALNKERQKLAAAQEDGNTDEAQQRIQQMERELAEMKETVERTTQQLDKDVRKMIDAEVHMADMQSTLTDLSTEVTNASTQQTQQSQRSRRRRGADQDEDQDEDEEYPDFDPTDPTNAMTQSTQRLVAPSSTFRNRLQRARDRYQSKSLVDRYSRHNSYRNFKNLVHDSGENGDQPLPQEHLWFSESGTAAPGQTAAGDDSDDDLQISKATISTKCPLTLQEFKDPVTSRKCPHSFEREAIFSMIDDPNNTIRIGGSSSRGARGGERAVQCPVPGCQCVLSAADLHADPVLKRKIARIQRANRAAEESDDDIDGGAQRPQSIASDDDSDMDVDDDPAMRFKTERMSGVVPSSQRVRGRPTVLEVGEDDED